MQPIKFSIEKVVVWEEWRADCFARLAYAASLPIPHLPELIEHDGRCVIVGAGPSVKRQIDSIKNLSSDEFDIVMSINGVHNWLIQQGRPPNIHVLFEQDIDNVKISLGSEAHADTTYYLASACRQENFQQLEGHKRVLWHAFLPPQEYATRISKLFPDEYMICGGYATLFRSLAIAVMLGYRSFDLFGCDSSFEESSHMDDYGLADLEPRISLYGKAANGDLKQFTTQGGLAYQVKQLLEFCSNKPELSLRVHGDGLLRYVHESRYPDQYTKGNENVSRI